MIIPTAMYSHLASILGFGLLILWSTQMAFAGAWVRDQGEVYSKVSFSHFTADQVFAAKNNKKLSGPEFDENSFTSYTEFGLSPKWTGIVSISYKDATSKLNGVENSESGLGNGWFFLKRLLKNQSYVLSGQLGAKIPLGYNREATPPLGDGQIDLEARFLLGKSFYPFPGYGNLEVGYRRRNGDVSDEFVYVLESGVNLTKVILAKVVLTRIESQSDDVASTEPFRHPNVFDEEYTKVSPGLLFFLKKGWGVEIGYDTVIAGGNTAAGETYSLGVFWQGKVKQ